MITTRRLVPMLARNSVCAHMQQGIDGGQSFRNFLFPINATMRAEGSVLICPCGSGRTRGRLMYKKVLLAYDGSIEGRLALREGAKLAQLCHSDVFLLAVVGFSSSSVAMEGGF